MAIGGHLVARLTGARFRGGTYTMETTVRTNRFTACIRLLVASIARADIRRYAFSTLATSLAFWSAFKLWIETVSLVTLTALHVHTATFSAASGALRNAQLPARLLQFVSLVATACSRSRFAFSMIASDRTGWHTFASLVPHKVRVTLASVRPNAESVLAGFHAHRLALAEVVHVSLVSGTTHLYAAQRWIGAIPERNVPTMIILQQ